MNRICKLTAISNRFTRVHRGLIAAAVLWLLFAAAACTPVRPVVKIGLIAPFEGLYRQTGYTALGAVRRAIADCAPENAAVLPLALDDSAQPQLAQRAAQKLLADPSVVAIIGPVSLEPASAATAEMTDSSPMWIVPAAIDSSGDFVFPDAGLDWLTNFVLEVAAMAEAQGAEYVLVAGLPDDWQAPVMAGVNQVVPPPAIRFVSPATYDFSEMGPNGAFLWLGQPHLGAQIASAMHSAQPSAAFWMGPRGEDPVFAARNSITGPIYWATWVTPQYNADSQQSASGTLSALLTYMAACHALAETLGAPEIDAQPLRLQAFRVDRSGQSEPVEVP